MRVRERRTVSKRTRIVKITPKASLVLALTLFALSTPVLRWLIMNGGALGLKSPGAISFCNVLFVGNLCAGLSVAAIFGIKGIYEASASSSSRSSSVRSRQSMNGRYETSLPYD